MSEHNSESLNEAIALLKDGVTIVIVSGEKHVTSNERGIKFILGLVENGDDILRGASIADKVVGRAAALLMVKGGVKEVYAEVLSIPAQEVFIKYGVKHEYKTLVQGIINRKGDGQCPMEKAVLGIDSPDEAAKVLREKLNAIN